VSVSVSTAKEKFQPGQYVKPTAAARAHFGETWSAQHKGGVVERFSRQQPQYMLVKINGSGFGASDFHMDHWEIDA
jgi:hypothetical protein